jgi:RNA polymerase sigma-70 factor (ECF subfamily)
MTGQTDLQLIERFKNGDEKAFNEIVLRYQERVYWIARRYLADHDDADDVVQEVFVKAYEALAGFRGDAAVSTWLYRITVNQALNVLRWKKVKNFVRIDEITAEQASADPTPGDILESNERRDLIKEAVSRLPEKQRAVFVLRYYQELSYEEIAQTLKTSVGGLKANYFHAVKKIQEFCRNAHRP